MSSRGTMPPKERRLRSRLCQLLHEGGLLRGSLIERRRKCGNPKCVCAHGEGHPGVYVNQSREGKNSQLYVPRSWEERTRAWLARYEEVRDLLEQLSELYRERLKNREEQPQRSGDSDAT